jgi:hypothetical protein
LLNEAKRGEAKKSILSYLQGFIGAHIYQVNFLKYFVDFFVIGVLPEITGLDWGAVPGKSFDTGAVR